MLFNNFEGDCRRVHVPYGDHSEPKLQVESHIRHAFPYPLYKNHGQKNDSYWHTLLSTPNFKTPFKKRDSIMKFLNMHFRSRLL